MTYQKLTGNIAKNKIKKPEKSDIRSNYILNPNLNTNDVNKLNFKEDLSNSNTSIDKSKTILNEIKKSNVVFVENISKEATKIYLEEIFGKFSGFKRIKTYINNYCVVEFNEINNAEQFVVSMNNNVILNNKLKLTYANS